MGLMENGPRSSEKFGVVWKVQNFYSLAPLSGIFVSLYSVNFFRTDAIIFWLWLWRVGMFKLVDASGCRVS